MDALSVGTLGAIEGGLGKVVYGPIRAAFPPATGSVTLRIPRGEDRTYDVYVYDATGALLDLTGYTAITFKFRKKTFSSPPTGAVVLTKTLAVVSPPQAGHGQLVFASADTLPMADAEYEFDAWAVDTDQKEMQVLTGSTLALTDGISFP